jgi:hypothetical protein
MRVCEKGKFLQIDFYKIKTEEFVKTKKMVLIRQILYKVETGVNKLPKGLASADFFMATFLEAHVIFLPKFC